MADTDRHATFPWGPVRAAAGLGLAHLAIVLWLVGPNPDTELFVRLGGLVAGPLSAEQPLRYLTSIFLHSGPSHVFWNGVSMIVFAVPLVLEVGYLTTAAIYLAAGILGGIAGALGVPDGIVLIGSSGAVSGLFGAWISITLLRSRVAPMPRLARLRILGVALLFLPSLLTPTTSTGNPISVGAHLGGLAAGLAAGILLWGLGKVKVPPVVREDDLGEDDIGEEDLDPGDPDETEAEHRKRYDVH